MQTGAAFTFGRLEKLKRRKEIAALVRGGKPVFTPALKVLYRENAVRETPHQAAFSVSKRHFKRAVDRNRVKRLLREAYRLQKHTMAYLPPLQLLFIFTKNEMPAYATVATEVAQALLRIQKRFEKTEHHT